MSELDELLRLAARAEAGGDYEEQEELLALADRLSPLVEPPRYELTRLATEEELLALLMFGKNCRR